MPKEHIIYYYISGFKLELCINYFRNVLHSLFLYLQCKIYFDFMALEPVCYFSHFIIFGTSMLQHSFLIFQPAPPHSPPTPQQK